MTNETSYLAFIWQEKSNHRYLLLALGSSVVLFILFKILYPYPDFFSDSYSYIEAAYNHLTISIWPIGYSKFLTVVHYLTHSDTALIAIQYFLLQISLLHLFFSVRYFFVLTQLQSKLTFVLFFINPLSLYLCNYVNSDPLFASVSIFWIVELIWIIRKPKIHHVFSQGILLFICFTIRNNAYYYPIVATACIFLSHQSVLRKIAGVLMPLCLIIPFIVQTQNEAYKKTGVRQFSLFTGWQLANNALYIYDKIDVVASDFPTPASKELNNFAKTYFTHIKSDAFHDYLNSYVGNYFIREPEAPLKKYYQIHYSSKKDTDIVRSWGRASADFEPFGKTIILKYPISYAQYFVLPNIGHYFLPPMSHLERYNYGQPEIDPIAATWFDLPTTQVSCISYDLQQFLILYVALFGVLNINLLWLWVRLFLRKRNLSAESRIPNEIWLLSLFFILNFAFSVSTTENILRYQFIPLVVIIPFSQIAINWLSINPTSQKIKSTSAKPTQLVV